MTAAAAVTTAAAFSARFAQGRRAPGATHMPYTYVNEISAKKISKLSDPVTAEARLQAIDTLCTETEPTEGDQVNQWLLVLKRNGIVAQKWKSSLNGIEIYPGGKRSEDRLAITVADGTVTAVNAWISEH